jgi:menaquinone-dependent protoporphyrinogen IX oxidase
MSYLGGQKMDQLSVLTKFGRTLQIVVGVVLLLIIILMILTICIVKFNDAYRGNYKSVMPAANPFGPKALIVYQPSASGKPAAIADQMAKGLNKAGYEVTLTYPGKHISDDLSQFSVIAFGSAVYVGRLSAQLTETMCRIKDYGNKTIILFSVGQMAETPEFDELRKCLGRDENFAQKFIASDSTADQQAYDLGYEAGNTVVMYDD